MKFLSDRGKDVLARGKCAICIVGDLRVGKVMVIQPGHISAMICCHRCHSYGRCQAVAAPLIVQ